MADQSKESYAGESYDLVASLSILERQAGEALLQAILDSGSGVSLADPLGRTLLMHAVHFAGIYNGAERDKILSGITCLLRHGADANLRDTSGETALSIALRLHQADIAILLLEYGATFPSSIN